MILKKSKNSSEGENNGELLWNSYKEKLYNFVRQWEWAFQDKSFCDSYYKKQWALIRHPAHLCEKWTIGFWTNSYPWEVITYEEAVRRKKEAIDARDNRITTDCLTDNQRIAMVDFIYQYSSYYANRMVQYGNSCNPQGAYNFIVAHRDHYKAKWHSWMVKREQLRINLFNQ